MSDKFTLDVRQAAELSHAFERNGFTNGDIKKMSSGDLLSRLLPVIRGNAEVAVIKHIIDLDADPFVPEGWMVEEHRKMGQFEWDPAKVALYLSKHQEGEEYIEGHKLRKEVVEQDPYNACLLDYLLDHPHLISEEWKEKLVFFWATIYRRPDGILYVRCLFWVGSGWFWCCFWLDDDFSSGGPAAVRSAS